ncbi:MAG TPA: Sec-independent protein translocase protein TatB [Sphingomicrobium sp.]|nr:Sec-independent protein translocase protein TatB [Sphingomicrobium sp.]
MFGVDSSELAVVAILALIFIGPKDLPKVMRTVGYWVGRVRGMARHFTAGIENMVREAELEEMEKRWREENERIMSVHPPDAHYPEPGQPDEMPPVAEVSEPTLPFDETQKEEELPIEKRPLP